MEPRTDSQENLPKIGRNAAFIHPFMNKTVSKVQTLLKLLKVKQTVIYSVNWLEV